MLAVKKVRKLIQTNPESPSAKVLSALVIALESNQAFPLNQLYTLNYSQFELALEILSEWRLDRYYSSKGRLLDLSVHAAELHSA
ncbi:hypothetical protein [Hydrogenophaga sp.]|uniref:hypothetical protein n=1 Tax=Hydrogenophaga sp. TaxID=1904254 RepID=UPI0025BB7802|nr:hypothetical protein [Hydrogenophaga sp.]MBT9463058.1 hypothetical protein [Hydrogenophaga sp.]